MRPIPDKLPRGMAPEEIVEDIGYNDGLNVAVGILRRAAETAHVNTAELLLRLAKEIEES